jgi:tetratricopeptide (TPR) repeat protein
MNLTLPRPLLAAPLLAFAAALVLWALLARGGPSLPGARAPGADVTPRLTGTDADIPKLQAAVRAEPGRADLRVDLAAAYLQKVRETGDPAFYTRAGGVLAPALKAHPDDADVLTEAGLLALSRHDFRGALALGERARAAAPEMVDVSAVLVDADVELGRYGAAERELQWMVDRKPNLAAYARVSYLRELHGDLRGAASAMRLAVAAGGPALENRAYVSALLGELERQQGHLGAARQDFRSSVVSVKAFPGGEAGLARLDAAEGDLAGAIARWRLIAARLPLPEYVIGLGEAELAAGRTATGERDLGLIDAERRLLQAAGVNTDVELAVFEADHGDRARAVALARRAWAEDPSVRAADALGWALTRSGDPAAGLAWARRALRLGSLDPVWRSHAGLTELAAGRTAAGRRDLRLSLRHGLGGYPWQAQRARRALAAHGAAAMRAAVEGTR